MKVRYSTNWMGPINKEWIEKNGDDWSAGRIDVYGDDVPEYTELDLGVMKSKDWVRFTRWLEGGFTTPEIWTTEQLVQAYEFHNPKITWFENNALIRKRCEALIIAMVGKELAKDWWNNPNKAFDGETPEQRYSVEPTKVYAYLMSRAGGEW